MTLRTFITLVSMALIALVVTACGSASTEATQSEVPSSASSGGVGTKTPFTVAQNERLNSAFRGFAQALASTPDVMKSCDQLVVDESSISEVLDCARAPLAKLADASDSFSRSLTSVADERNPTPCTESLRSFAESLNAISAGTESLLSASSTSTFAGEWTTFNQSFGPGQDLDNAITEFQQACSATSSTNTQGGDPLEEFMQAMGEQIVVSDNHFTDSQGAAAPGDWGAIKRLADAYQQDADAFRQICADLNAADVASSKASVQQLGGEWCQTTTQKWAMLADMTRALAEKRSQTYEDAVGQETVDQQSQLVDQANRDAAAFQSAYCDEGGKFC
jgi:hypothetical protein